MTAADILLDIFILTGVIIALGITLGK